jgi:ribosomal-protein-alanine N-acetyltransferase
MAVALLHNDARRIYTPAADELETARLRLRMFTPEDLDALCEITRDPEVMRYIGQGRPLTRDETRFNLTTIINAFRRRGFGRWALVKKDGGAPVGYCGLSSVNEEVGVELAYLLAKAEWGQGLVTEAGRACLRYSFETLRFESVAGLTVSDNHKSRRTLERLGMKYLRDGHFYGYDCVWYTARREEWHDDDSAYRVISQEPSDPSRVPGCAVSQRLRTDRT